LSITETLSIGAAIAIVGLVWLWWRRRDTATRVAEHAPSARLPDAGEPTPAGTLGRIGLGARARGGPTAECERTADPPTLEWRFSRFMSCGVDAAEALKLAADREADVHELAGLVARGCSPDLAARIVAPLTAGGEPPPEGSSRRPKPGSRSTTSRSSSHSAAR
jgi:hypothetical protein